MTDFNTVIWQSGDEITQSKMSNMVNNNLYNQEFPKRRLHKHYFNFLNPSSGPSGQGTLNIYLDGDVIMSEEFGDDAWTSGTSPDADGIRISSGGSAQLASFRNYDVSSKSGFYELKVEFLDPDSNQIDTQSNYYWDDGSEVVYLDKNFYIDDLTGYITVMGEFWLARSSAGSAWLGRLYNLEVWTHGQSWSDFT